MSEVHPSWSAGALLGVLAGVAMGAAALAAARLAWARRDPGRPAAALGGQAAEVPGDEEDRARVAFI